MPELIDDLRASGLELVSFSQPGLYALDQLVPKAMLSDLKSEQKMALAENLRGSIKTHIFYAVKAGQNDGRIAQPSDMKAIPHLKGVSPSAVAQHVAKKGKLRIALENEAVNVVVSKTLSTLIGRIDGHKNLGEIAAVSGLSGFEFQVMWTELHQSLAPWGLLLYSGILRK